MKQPRPYQIIDAKRASKQNLAIFNATGTGKSLIIAETIRHLLEDFPNSNFPILVVVPKATVEQMKDMLIDQLHNCPNPITPKIYSKMFFDGHDELFISVVNHEMIRTEFNAFKQIQFLAVIVDEAHKMCNVDNKFTKTVKQLNAVRKIAATATPRDRDPSAMWSIMNWIAPATYPKYTQWRNEHSVYKDGKFLRVKDWSKLAEALAPFAVLRQVKDADVMPYMKDKQIEKVVLKLKGRQLEAYETVESLLGSSISTDVEDEDFSITHILAHMVRMQQATSLPSGIAQLSAKDENTKIHPFRGFDESVKTDWSLEFLENQFEEDPKEKTILFFSYTASLVAFQQRLEAQANGRFKIAVLKGGMSSDEFNQQVKMFKTDSECIVLLTIIESGGTGLDLPMANTSIFYDMEYSLTKMTQASDRIRNVDQDSPVVKRLFFLVCKGTIDEDFWAAYKEKQSEHRFMAHALLKVQERTGISVPEDTINYLRNKN